MKTNWRTTLAGVLAAIGTVLSTSALLPGPWGAIAGAIGALGTALLGLFAQDKKNGQTFRPVADTRLLPPKH